MERTIFPKIKGALLEIRSTVNTHIGEANSSDSYQAHPHDTFELTGNVYRLDSHGRNDYMMKLLVEGELDPNDSTKYWIPLIIRHSGPDHFVSDKHQNELGPMCYTNFNILCMM